MLRLRGNELVKSYDYVSLADPAVDKPSEEDEPALEEFNQKWKQYLDGVGDPPLREGVEPTVFRLRHLRGFALAELDDFLAKYVIGRETVNRGAAMAAFALAVESVRPLQDENGNPLEVELEVDNKNGVKFLSEKTLSLFPQDVIDDVGARVLTRTYVSPKS